MVDWRGLHECGRAQHGVLGLHDGERYGLSRGALLRHAQRHGWERASSNVVLLPGRPLSFEAAAMAAVREVGGRVLVARWSAAYLWGMTRQMPSSVELVVPADRRAQDVPGGTMWRSRSVTLADAAALGPLPLTTPARTVLDLAAVTPLDPLRALVIDARQRRALTLAEVAQAADRLAHARGRGKVTQVLRELDEQCCDSMLEWHFRARYAPPGCGRGPGPSRSAATTASRSRSTSRSPSCGSPASATASAPVRNARA